MVIQLNAWGVGYGEAKALIDELAKLREENAKAMAMLKRIQQDECPICGTDDEYGHEVDCELTFDIDPEDVKDKYPGDTAKDFSMRALYRAKEDLNELLKNSKFKHYHIKVLPNPCIEFD